MAGRPGELGARASRRRGRPLASTRRGRYPTVPYCACTVLVLCYCASLDFGVRLSRVAPGASTSHAAQAPSWVQPSRELDDAHRARRHRGADRPFERALVIWSTDAERSVGDGLISSGSQGWTDKLLAGPLPTPCYACALRAAPPLHIEPPRQPAAVKSALRGPAHRPTVYTLPLPRRCTPFSESLTRSAPLNPPARPTPPFETHPLQAPSATSDSHTLCAQSCTS